MNPRATVIPALWLMVVAGAYLFGRHQGHRPGGDAPVSPRTPGAEASRSLLGSGAGSRIAGFSSGEIDVDLKGPAFIAALIASRETVSGEHLSLAVLKAAEESDPVESNLMFAQLLQLLTPENAKAAIETMDELPRSRLVGDQLGLFRFAWGQLDGPAAAEYLSTLNGRSKSYAAHSVMSGWASRDPAAAIAWVESIEEETDRKYHYRGIVEGLAKTDPDFATSFARERHAAGSSDADDYISMIAREQLRRGLEVATPWIDTLTAPELKQDAVYRVARELVDREPERAARWVEAYAGNEFAVGAIAEVADEWAEDDGASAVAWVAGLPPGTARVRAFREVFNEWTQDDPFAAADYLVTMPTGDDRDAAVQALSRRHVRDDPEAAVTWAASITDEALRNSTLIDTGQQWMRSAPEPAAAWLEASGLPDEMKQKIRNTRQERVVLGRFDQTGNLFLDRQRPEPGATGPEAPRYQIQIDEGGTRRGVTVIRE